MALVGYDSSDEDQGLEQSEFPVEASSVPSHDIGDGIDKVMQQENSTQTPLLQAAVEPITVALESTAPAPHASARSHPPGPSFLLDAAAIGPTLPPAEGAEAYPEDMDQDPLTPQPSRPTPPSPYSANRNLIHTLTLPTVPNMDIPPSPPGSPSSSEAQAALTAKFDQFLQLKRKKGTHFNARIADSHPLKNPPLMDKLLGFVGLGVTFEDGSVEGAEQYATTLPIELWDPAAFPDWAYRGPLRKAQEKLQKERGRDRGEAVHFVPAST